MLFFYGIVDGFNGNYGIAIILFTVFARLVTLPSTISQQKGMAKQQRLAPKIRRIQEKYAGNQQKIQLMAALIADLNPVGIFISSVFLSGLQIGGSTLQRSMSIPSEIATIIQCCITLFVSIKIVINFKHKKKHNEVKGGVEA